MVKAQTVRGTPVTPDITIPITDYINPAHVSENFVSGRLYDNYAKGESRKGSVYKTFDIATELSAVDTLILFKYLFGKYTFTADTPVAGANTHLFELATLVADKTTIWDKCMTAEFGRDAKYYTLQDVAVSGLAITIPVPGMIPAVFSCLGNESSEAASGETASISAGSLVMDNLQAVIKAGVAASEVVIPIYDATFNLNRGLTAKRLATSTTPDLWVPAPKLDCNGTFKIGVEETERAAVLDDLNNSDEVSLIYEYTSDQIVTGSTAYKVTIAVKEAKYTGVAPDHSEMGDHETYTWEFGRESVASGLTVTVITDAATL
jgi:hypothetical protein